MVIKSVGFGGDQKNSVAFITPADLIVRSFELRILSNSKKTQSIDVRNSFVMMNLLPEKRDADDIGMNTERLKFTQKKVIS
jgi:hypothetical protein